MPPTIWSRWLDALPVLRSRRTAVDLHGRLKEAKTENRALRRRLDTQTRRLEDEKRRRRRIERRLMKRLVGGMDGQGASPLLVFEHVPKTAGSTFLSSYLVTALPPNERWVLPGGGRDVNEANRRKLLSLSPRRLREIRVVGGHHADLLRPNLSGARYITLVRDPVERTISAYLHAMFHPGGEQMFAAVRRSRMTFRQYVETGTANVQSRSLLGPDHETLDHRAMSRRLQKRYALVGYTEAFAQFLFLLHVTEKLPLCLFNNRLVRAERQDFRAEEADLELVRRLNSVDVRLHELVQAEFQQRVDGLSPDQRQVMDRYVDALQAFQTETGGTVGKAVRLDDDWDGLVPAQPSVSRS